MAKQDKSSRSGFVIKLSTETAQKLAKEEQQAKNKLEEVDIKTIVNHKSAKQQISSDLSDGIQDANISVRVTKYVADEDSSPSQDSEKTSLGSKDNKTKEVAHSSQDHEKPEAHTDSTNASWGEYAPYITYEGEEAIYTDPTSKQRYTWSQETNSWVTKESDTSRVYSYEDDAHVYTDADGSKFFWDNEKKAWIPKVDDDFLAFYQMSYGFVDNKVVEKKEDDRQKEVKKSENTAGVKRKNDPQWFEPSEDKNTKVYVSNLPLDLTEEEFVNFMQKCGLVERDPRSQKMKVKLYMDKEQNCFKGDALCTYIKIESVDLALKLLDGSDFKGNKVKVEKAHFELRGEYNPALKPKKKRKKELEKIKKMQQKLFDWRPEKFIGERSKHERIVIIKNLFQSSDFDKEVQLILDYQLDLREEATKCGDVRKVVLYDRHPEGVAQITMKEPEQADAVVELMNGRWFGKRQITAEIWDGRTKYRIAETDADIGKRIDKWEKFLEEKDDDTKESDTEKKTKEDSTSKQDTEVSTEIKPLDDDVAKESDTERKTTEDSISKGDIEVSTEIKSLDDNVTIKVVDTQVSPDDSTSTVENEAPTEISDEKD